MTQMPLPLFLSFLLLPAAFTPLAAWGVQGHQMAATAALKDLPPELAAWFAGEETTVSDHANDPDRWKNRDPLEGPRHFLDCETYGGPAGIPWDENAAKAKLGSELFQKTGQVPWVILDRAQRLAKAFGTGDPHQVALEAAYLCHYTADCNVPLHATVNYNGAATGQHGVHGRWETGLLRRIVNGQGWVPDVRPAVPVSDPQAATMAWLAESFALAPGVLADDKAALPLVFRGAEPDEGYWERFLQGQEANVKERLALSGQRTAQMILLAWADAGKPTAPAALGTRSGAFRRGEAAF